MRGQAGWQAGRRGIVKPDTGDPGYLPVTSTSVPSATNLSITTSKYLLVTQIHNSPILHTTV